jgi:TonB family protein
VAAVGAVAWVLTQPADGTAASEGEAPTAPATPPASRQVELLGDPASPVWIDGKPVARGSGGPRLSSQPVGPHTVVVAAGSGCEAASPELVGPCCRTETVSLDLPAGDGPFPWQPPAVTAPDAKRALSLWATDATGADAPKLKWWINDKPVPAGTTELKDLPVGMIRWRLESGTCPAAALGCAGDGTCPPGCTSMRGEVELACGDGPQILSLTLPAAGEAASTTPAAPPAATDADGVRPTEPKPERKPRTEATQKQPTEPITTAPVEVRLDYQATVVGVSVDKGLDAATSGGGVAAKLGTVESCFAKSHTTGEFRGTVVVDFKVDKSGIVEASSVTASTRSGNNGVDACAVSAVKNAKISTKKPGAGRVKITFVAQ